MSFIPSKLITTGLWKHYKGSIYRVTGFGRHTETWEPYVVYHSIQNKLELWIRPMKMFLETVEVGDHVIPRFKKVIPQRKSKK